MAMPQARIHALQVGPVISCGVVDAPDRHDRQWTTGMFKLAVSGAVWLGRERIAGDAQADLKHHGGPDKAVNVYPSEHYAAWRQELSNGDMGPGAFGENLTTEGQLEDAVCIGDIFRIGDDATVQVSQPRQPCWKLARRWRMDDLPRLVIRSGRTGWYLRVLQEGMIAAGASLQLVDRPFPACTISAANRLMHGPLDGDGIQMLIACQALSPVWRDGLARRAAAAVK
jgi:MOSC domain-containing protein YiiM